MLQASNVWAWTIELKEQGLFQQHGDAYAQWNPSADEHEDWKYDGEYPSHGRETGGPDTHHPRLFGFV